MIVDYDLHRTQHDISTEDATGGLAFVGAKTIIYPVGKYEVTVNLASNNEFIGISAVKINKSFLSYEQETKPKGFHDVADFYRE
ncbi:MAG: hypothetical protein GY861_23255 [bacterium]|nr:hypothetical protein [bacterium]